MNIHEILPTEFVNFFLVLVFSLLIGMGQRRHHLDQDDSELFGTDRTFTFIGLLGYVLYEFDPDGIIPFLTGLLVLGLLLAIQYFQKIKLLKDFGLTSSILALLTYCLPIFVFTQPIWLTLSFVVALLILTEMKSAFRTISRKASQQEFITLAKFIAFAGIILPLLPTGNIADFIPVSPYQVWLAIIVVSGVSYVSYIIKKFVFPDSGILLTGVLGGIYSSTATTIILARREKQEQTGLQSVSAIMLANGMMYLRVLVLTFVFNVSIGLMLTLPFLLMFGFASGIAKMIQLKNKSDFKTIGAGRSEQENKNPLELKTATIFGILFVAFALITDAAIKHYGDQGVAGLAFLVGIFDVDPFLLFLVQQKTGIGQAIIVLAIINATNSNNLMKMVYAVSLCSRKVRVQTLVYFLILVAFGLLVSLAFYLIKF